MRARPVSGAIDVDCVLESCGNAFLDLVPRHLRAIAEQIPCVGDLGRLCKVERPGEVIRRRSKSVDLKLRQRVGGEVAKQLVLLRSA